MNSPFGFVAQRMQHAPTRGEWHDHLRTPSSIDILQTALADDRSSRFALLDVVCLMVFSLQQTAGGTVLGL